MSATLSEKMSATKQLSEQWEKTEFHWSGLMGHIWGTFALYVDTFSAQ